MKSNIVDSTTAEVVLPEYVKFSESDIFFRPTVIDSYGMANTPFFILESIFSGKVINNCLVTGKIEIEFSDVFEGGEKRPMSNYKKRLTIERAIDYMKDNPSMIKLSRKEVERMGPQFANYNELYLNLISFIGLTDNDTIEVKFNEDFLTLVYNKLKSDEHLRNGKVVVFDGSSISSIKNTHTRNLAYMIAKYKMTCNQVTLTVDETIDVLGCHLSEKNSNARYIKANILKKAKENLENTPYRFNFKIVKRLEGNKSGFKFTFESNKETNTKLLESGESKLYIKHLENIGYNSTAIKFIIRQILTGTLTEEYVNYVINKSYDYLLNSKPKLRQQHNPASYVYKAFAEEYYKIPFESESNDCSFFKLSEELPSFESLRKGSQNQTKKIIVSNNSLDLFESNASKDVEVLRKIINRAFPAENALIEFCFSQDISIWDVTSIIQIENIEELREQILETICPAFILKQRRLLLATIKTMKNVEHDKFDLMKNSKFVKEFMPVFFRNGGQFSEKELKRLTVFIC